MLHCDIKMARHKRKEEKNMVKLNLFTRRYKGKQAALAYKQNVCPQRSEKCGPGVIYSSQHQHLPRGTLE